MAAIALRDVNQAVFVIRPRKGGVYLKTRSFVKGVTPAHLEGYTEKFTKAAGDCKAVMTGLEGNEKVEAFNACIGGKLEK